MFAVRGVVSGVLVVGIAACLPIERPDEETRVGSQLGVTVTYQAGNPTCADLGYAYEGKIDSPSFGTTTTIALPGGNSATFTTTANGKTVTSWSSTIALDAVLMKGGDGANIYTYDPEATSGSSLQSPDNDGGNQAQISHINFCFDFELAVSKTAATTFSRDHGWTIAKAAADTSLTLALDQVFLEAYTVTLTRTHTDSEWAVSGTITVTNPDPGNTASVTSVTDNLAGVGALTVTCAGVTFPHALAPNATLTCTYSATLASGTGGTNTATATVATGSLVNSGTGTAEVTFGTPTTEADECVTVDDTLYGSLGTVCDSHVFNYNMPITYATCGQYTVPNTASFATNDNAETGSASDSVAVDVPCVNGCTLTQGYWKTHSIVGPAPYDATWNGREDDAFFLSGMTYHQVLWTPPMGNPYFNLAHQYIAALLNGLNGADFTAAQATFDAATALLSTYTPATAGALRKNSADRAKFYQYATALDRYNNGLTGPGHCSE